jgi:hypothetical protein
MSMLDPAGADKPSLLLKITLADIETPKLQAQIPAIGYYLATIELPRLTLDPIAVGGAIPRFGLDGMTHQAGPKADGVIFVMNGETHEDEMQNALRVLEARLLSLSDTSKSPLMVLVSRSDEKVCLDLALTQF